MKINTNSRSKFMKHLFRSMKRVIDYHSTSITIFFCSNKSEFEKGLSYVDLFQTWIGILSSFIDKKELPLEVLILFFYLFFKYFFRKLKIIIY